MRVWYYGENCIRAGQRAWPESDEDGEANGDLLSFTGTDDEIRSEADRSEATAGGSAYRLRIARTLRDAVPPDPSPGISGAPDCPICDGGGEDEDGRHAPCANCGGTGRRGT